jgi:hypothetical protein
MLSQQDVIATAGTFLQDLTLLLSILVMAGL